MKSLQEVFNTIQIAKKKQKELRAAYKEALERLPEHKEAVDTLKSLREKKKHLEDAVKSEFSKEFDKIDELKIELEEQNMMLADIAMSKIMNGETVEIVDEHQNIYEPTFAVKFKKTMTIAEEANEKKPVSSQNQQVAQSTDIPQVNMFE